MAKQGYIDKVKDMVSGEPRFDYHLGPRGKVEYGPKGALDVIKHVSPHFYVSNDLGIWR